MKVFLGAFGDAGHAFPMLALGTELVARAHQRNQRRRVAGLQRPPNHPASSATARSCASRSSNVHAIGATISVPTPASR